MNDVFRNSVFAFFLLFSIFKSVHASNEFEVKFKENIKSLTEAYAPVDEKEKELIELDRRGIQAQHTFDHKSSVPILFQGVPLEQLPELLKAVNEREDASNELYDLRMKFNHAFKEFLYLESQYNDEKILPLINQYSWAIPNHAALATISKYGPIIELGAGSGYWAHLLETLGVDIVAFDDYSWEQAGLHQPNQLWFSKLQKGNESELDNDKNLGRNLLISWPPRDDFAFNALSRYRGDFFIYVGELPGESFKGSATGNDRFFQYLNSEFEMVEKVEIPNWPGFRDQVFVFKRKMKQPRIF